MTDAHESHEHCGPGYASPQEAMKADPEKVLYTIALYAGTGIEEPD
jgi:methanethiol oxidase